MSFPRRLSAIVLAAAAAGLIVAGCGGSGGSSSSPSSTSAGGLSSSSSATSADPPAQATTVSATKKPKLGWILVNNEGFTVYTFSKDKRTNQPCLETCPERSACYEACEEAWPPVPVTGTATAMGVADPSKVGTTRRNNGVLQMTYAGQPLYTFSGDEMPGEMNGHGEEAFEGEWTAMTASGTPAPVTHVEKASARNY